MSAQSTKKKRIGSRRRVVNQNETSEPEGFHVRNSASAAPDLIKEDDTESVDVSAHADTSETQNPSLSEISSHRRKLGSSRRKKQISDSVREDGEETRLSENPRTTQTSLEIQPQMQEELSRGSAHDVISVTHDGSLYSPATPERSSDALSFTATDNPEPDQESLSPKSENVPSHQDNTDHKVISDSSKLVETQLIAAENTDTHQSDDLKQDAHLVPISELMSLSVLSCPSVDQQLVEPSNATEVPEEMYSVTEKESKEGHKGSESLWQSGNLHDYNVGSESLVQSVVMHSSSAPEVTADGSSSLQNVELGNSNEQISSPNKELPKDEEQNEHFNPPVKVTPDDWNKVSEQEVTSKEMLEMDRSSESVSHGTENTSVGSLVSIPEHAASSLHSRLVDQQKLHQSNSTEIPEELPNSVTEVQRKDGDAELLQQDDNLQDNNVESESLVQSVVMHCSSAPEVTADGSSTQKNIELENNIEQLSSPNKELPKDEEQNEHFNFLVEGTPDDWNKVYKQEVTPKEMHELDRSSESVTHDATENSDIISGNPMDQAEVSDTNQSEFIVENIHDSAKQEDLNPDPKQDVKCAKVNSLEPLVDTNPEKPQISGTEIVDTAPGEVRETEDQDSQPQLNNTSFSPAVNRRKLGSSRRKKGRLDAKDPVSESQHRPKEEAAGNTSDNEPLEATNISLTPETTVLDKPMETLLEGTDPFVSTQTEEVRDERKENANVGSLVSISEHAASSLHSTLVDQQILDQSNSTEIPQEELPNSVTEVQRKDGDGDAELLHQDDNLQDNNVESESQFKSEDAETSITPEISKDKHSSGELTEPERSSEDQFPTSEEPNELFNLSEVKDAHRSEDPEYSVHEQEVTPKVMHEVDRSSESLTHDATDNSDIIPGSIMDQTEVSDTNQSEFIVENVHDSTKQEDSNPDPKQDVNFAEVNSLEPLVDTNPEKPQISGTEIVDTAPGEVYETEDQVKHDSHPGVDQTVVEKEELFSEVQESDSASETLQSEIQNPLDSQPQLNNTSFSPAVNRRKLGSSRRKKGRLDAKDPVSESQHRPKEEAAGNTSDNEPLEATNIPVTPETTVLDKPMETLLEGTDTFVSTQTEEVRDERKENANVGSLVSISEHAASSLHSTLVDQQILDQSNSTEIPEEELPNSVTEVQIKDGDGDAELLQQEDNLQENNVESESQFKSEDAETSLTPEISKDKHSSGELTEPERSTEDQFPTSEEPNELFNLSEVKDAHRSEDPEYSVHEQEVTPKVMHELDHSSESVTHDATDNSDIIPGSIMDQAEVSDTNQSEFIVENVHDSTKQEDSNPDPKQDVNFAKVHSLEPLVDTNPEKPQISGTEIVDTAPGEVYETEDQVKHDSHPGVDQTVVEKEELFSEVQESDSASETLQSEIQNPLDSQPQLNNTSFSPAVNRRKLGSSRRKKGRLDAKDPVSESQHRPKEEAAGNTSDNEPLEAENIPVTPETTVLDKPMETLLEGTDTFVSTQTEEVRDERKENANVGSLVSISEHAASSLHSTLVDQQILDQSNSTEIPEEELPNSVTEVQIKDGDGDAELLQQEDNLQENNVESESQFKSEDAETSLTPEISKDKHSSGELTEPERSTEDQFPTSEEPNELFNLSEVKDAHRSEDPEYSVHEQEVTPKVMHELDRSSESVTHDATDNSDIIPGSIMDQTEVSDRNQSEFIVENVHDSTKQEDSNPDPKQDVNFAKVHSLEPLVDTNPEKPQISGTEIVDTAPGEVYETEDQVKHDSHPGVDQTVVEKEELFSEVQESDSASETLQSEIQNPLDSQPQLNNTSFSPAVNRRKLGSSRRKKGRLDAKDPVSESQHRPKEEAAGNTSDNEPLEAENIPVTPETTVLDKPMETLLEGTDTFVSTQTEEVRDERKENANVGSLVSISEHAASSLHSTLVDQQILDQSNSTEIPEEELPNSVTEVQIKDGDGDAELLQQEDNLQENNVESESQFKSEDAETSLTPEISKDKHSSGELTEPERSTEDQFPTSEEPNEHFNLSEVKDAHRSEDPEYSIHEQEVVPKEKHELNHSSESVTHDATDNSDIISGNPMDQAEVSDTNQSEFIVENVHDSAKQEDSNPDNKQDVKSAKVNSLEPLVNTNPEKPQISGTEIVDTAPGEVRETEDQVKHDSHPGVDQTVVEKEELFSEVQESDSASETLQSEIQNPLDSQPQLNNTSFSPAVNRRKLGSSRRKKGRLDAKDPVSESQHRPKEEAAGNTSDNEPLEATNISLTPETTVLDKPMETLLEGTDTFVSTQTEEVRDERKENANVGTLVSISEHAASSLHSTLVDQQILDQSNSTEIPEEELPNLVTEVQRKDGDGDAELLHQDDNLQDNNVESESQFKSEDAETSITPEISKDKHSSGELTEPERSTEDQFPTSEEPNELFNLSEVTDAHRSEDPEYSVHEQEVTPKVMHEVDRSSESLTHDATDNSDIIPGSIMDQTEVSDTNQSEFIVENVHDSTKQEDSNPDPKQDVNFAKVNSLEPLVDTNPEKPQISGTEIVDTAPGEVYETEDQVKHDSHPGVDQTVVEKEELFSEVQESDSASETLQSEIQNPLDSQPQLNNTSFSPAVNRRKLGSSRRKKGRLDAKDPVSESQHRPKEEAAGNTSDNEPLEATNISVTPETTVLDKPMETLLEGTDTFVSTQTEEVSDERKENANVGSLVSISEHAASSLHSTLVDQQILDQSNSTEIPQEELPNLVTEVQKKDGDAELLWQDDNLQDNNVESESQFKSEDAETSITPEISKDKHSSGELTEPERSTEDQFPTSEEPNELFNLSEVKDAHRSEDPEYSVHEQEVTPKVMHELDRSSESVTHDAPDNSDIIPGSFMDQTEVSDRNQSEFIVENVHDSTKQEDSNPDNKQDVNFAKVNSLEPLVDTNPEKPQISGTEIVDTAPGEVYETEDQVKHDSHPGVDQTVVEKEELFSEVQESDSASETLQSEIQNPLDSQPQLNNTSFSPAVNRRKLGSSRRKKGRLDAKDPVSESQHRPKEEAAGNTSDNEPLEATNISVTPETTVLDKPMETLLEGTDTFVSTQTEEVSDERKENANVGSLVSISEHAASSLHSTEELAKSHSVTEKESIEGDKVTELLRRDENVPDSYPVIDSHMKSDKIEPTVAPEIITENSSPGTQVDIEHSVEQTVFLSSKEGLGTNKEEDHVDLSGGGGSLHSDDIINEFHEEGDRKTEIQSASSLQALQSEVNVPLDSDLWDDSLRVKEQTHTGSNPIGHRRKLGSSRRTKIQQVKDIEKIPAGDSDVSQNVIILSSANDDSTNSNKDIKDEDQNPIKEPEPVLDVPEESRINTALGSFNNQQSIQEDSNSGSEGTSNPRRKMGSTRRTQLRRKLKEGMDDREETEEGDFKVQADKIHGNEIEAVNKLQVISHNENATPSQNAVYKEQQETNEPSCVHREPQSTQRNTTSGIGDSTSRHPEQCTSHNGKAVNPVPFVCVADSQTNNETNVDVNMEPFQLDDFTGTDTDAASVPAGSCSVTPLVPSNNADVANTGITEGSFVSLSEATQSLQNHEQRSESIEVLQDPKTEAAPVVADLEIVKSEVRGGAEQHRDAQAQIQEMDEGVHTRDLEMRNASPDLSPANRRRKMGSTRRNLVSRSKGEESRQKQQVENEAQETAAKAGDVKTVRFKDTDGDSEQQKEKVFETVEYRHTAESHVKPQSHQTFEENPASHRQLVETEDQLSPGDIPATSPKHDATSETASGGRRRKLGSHRKSHGRQSKGDGTKESGRDVRSTVDQSSTETTGEASLGLDEISEVEESGKKPSSNISSSKAGEPSRPVSEETQVPPLQHTTVEIHPGHERPKAFSLGNPNITAGSPIGAASRSKSYNVMMVGDSSVGKTSFMKRAQSGKFSLDLPASVGLDSCMWTVIVDGKPVVLQLWDTAGQERFHSMTRQIFHKAQAFLLMYDVTSCHTFSAVSYWANCIQEDAAENVTILLLGNKNDCAERRVKTEEGEILAQEYKFEFMECSAATGENVVQSLETVARMLSEKDDIRAECAALTKEPRQKKSSGCC